MKKIQTQCRVKQRWVPLNLYLIIKRKHEGVQLTELECKVHCQWRTDTASRYSTRLMPYLNPGNGKVVFKEPKSNYYLTRQAVHLL
jgi:hypothetical protein